MSSPKSTTATANTFTVRRTFHTLCSKQYRTDIDMEAQVQDSLQRRNAATYRSNCDDFDRTVSTPETHLKFVSMLIGEIHRFHTAAQLQSCGIAPLPESFFNMLRALAVSERRRMADDSLGDQYLTSLTEISVRHMFEVRAPTAAFQPQRKGGKRATRPSL